MRTCLWDECESKTSNPKFCSLSCGTKYQRRYRDVWSKSYDSKQCQQCGETFEVTSRNPEKVFCNRSCSAKFNNALRSKAQSKGKCLRCGEECKRIYCSVLCSSTHKHEKKIASWLDGTWDGTASHGLASPVRNFLIAEAGNRCSSPTCAVPGGFAEINPITNKVPLEVDHLDGNCYNNKRENLMVVCPNCHALTPTYRALNKNSGRAYRRNAGVA